MRLRAVLVVSSCFQALHAHRNGASLENFASSNQGAHSHVAYSEPSSQLLLPPSSPDCWLDTLQELYPQDDSRSNGRSPLELSTCLQLDTHKQQALGLRLTKCHLETMGRSLVTTDYDNVCDDLHHPSGVKECLSNLSTTAATTYTLFFKDLHYVCTRLLQESVTNRYYRTTQDLEQVSKLAEDRLRNILQQQEESSVFWKEKEVRMTQWFHEQTQLSANQALEFQEQMQSKQQQDLHRHKEELQSLADALQTTKASIQPWTQLVDLVFRYIPLGYAVVKIGASMLGTMAIIMILTPHIQLRRTRFKLFLVVLLDGLGEMVLLWLENQDEIELTATERLELSEGWQKFVMSFLCAFYLSNLFSFCCGWNNDLADDEDEEEDDYGEEEEEELLGRTTFSHRENELLERLHLRSYQQQHWSAMVAQQQQQLQHRQEQHQSTLPNVNVHSNHPPPSPALIRSTGSGSFASSASIVAAPWNVPPSPWNHFHRPIAVYPDVLASNGNTVTYATNCRNHDHSLPPIKRSIDLPTEEPDDDDEERSGESRDDTVFDNRKRTCLEMAEGSDEDSDTEKSPPVVKKGRVA